MRTRSPGLTRRSVLASTRTWAPPSKSRSVRRANRAPGVASKRTLTTGRAPGATRRPAVRTTRIVVCCARPLRARVVGAGRGAAGIGAAGSAAGAYSGGRGGGRGGRGGRGGDDEAPDGGWVGRRAGVAGEIDALDAHLVGAEAHGRHRPARAARLGGGAVEAAAEGDTVLARRELEHDRHAGAVLAVEAGVDADRRRRQVDDEGPAQRASGRRSGRRVDARTSKAWTPSVSAS